MKQRSIILIGPSKAGKSTVSKRLAEMTKWKGVDLDRLRWDYYAEVGYDAEKAKAIRAEGGLEAIAVYWKLFDPHAVARILEDHSYNHVIAFGAGHSVYDDDQQFAQVQQLLTPFPHIILLLPSPDSDESLKIFRQRLNQDDPELSAESVNTIMEFEDYFLHHPSNASLATMTLYTAGKSVDATCQEIIEKVKIQP